jgi:hypothetical protein
MIASATTTVFEGAQLLNRHGGDIDGLGPFPAGARGYH